MELLVPKSCLWTHQLGLVIGPVTGVVVQPSPGNHLVGRDLNSGSTGSGTETGSSDVDSREHCAWGSVFEKRVYGDKASDDMEFNHSPCQLVIVDFDSSLSRMNRSAGTNRELQLPVGCILGTERQVILRLSQVALLGCA